MSDMSLSVMEILLFCDQNVINLSQDCKTKVKLRKIDVFPLPSPKIKNKITPC